MTQNEIEEVVRGLTAAMRDAARWAKGEEGRVTRNYFERTTYLEMQQVGLIDQSYRLTPLGLAVRNHLSQTKEAERGA